MFILFDIGATKMRIGVSSDGRTLHRVKVVSTLDSFIESMALFRRLADELLTESAKAKHGKREQNKKLKIQAAAGGIAGPLDRKRGALLAPPNLPDWQNRPLRKTLEKILGARVYLENDTALVGLGEAVRGAGKGKPIVAYITVSTGINGVRIVNGKIDQSAMGFEIGHQIIEYNPAYTLEYFIGAASLKKRYGMPATEIRDPAVWETVTKHLAIGVNNTILHWSPHIVVLGGGTVRSGIISVTNVEKIVREILTIFPKSPPIKKAALGDLGGLHGALVFLGQQRKI